MDNLICQGITCGQILDACYEWTLKTPKINDFKKVKIIKIIGDIMENIKGGGRDDLNMMLFFDKLELSL